MAKKIYKNRFEDIANDVEPQVSAQIAEIKDETASTSPAPEKPQEGAKIDTVEAPVEEAVAEKKIAPKTKTVSKPKKAETVIPDNFYARRTIFMTFEQGAALDIIARERGLTKTEVTMMVFDAALEQIEPGITDRVKIMAQRDREREFNKMTEVQREKYIKSAQKG